MMFKKVKKDDYNGMLHALALIKPMTTDGYYYTRLSQVIARDDANYNIDNEGRIYAYVTGVTFNELEEAAQKMQQKFSARLEKLIQLRRDLKILKEVEDNNAGSAL